MFTGAVRYATGSTPVSRWVWVLLAFAIGYALLLVTQTMTLDLPNASSIAFSTAPALVAAALMYVAPRARLIQLAAIAFVTPVVVRAVGLLVTGELVLLAGTPSNSYLAFVRGVDELLRAFSEIAFLFTLIAVLALAAYIGRIGTRTGWLIVAVSAVLAAAQAFAVASTAPSAEFLPAHLIALWIVAPVTLVAWGYLLGVARERRRVLLSVAAAIVLANTVLSLLTLTVFSQALTAGPTDLIRSIYSATAWALDAVYWLSLIGGVLLELRPDRRIESTTGPHWQTDPSVLRH